MCACTITTGCGGDSGDLGLAPVDAGSDATGDSAEDGGVEAGTEASDDAGTDATPVDGASDSSADAPADGGTDGGDAADDAAIDAIADGEADGPDASADAGDASTFCTPGETQPCYSGPAGTLGVGACKAGIEVCATDGSAFGACFGEVTPVPETCNTPIDDDCDGDVNEDGDGCLCTPSSTVSCYTGPAGTLGLGICHSGTQSCNALGSGYGACAGEVTPLAENCATYFDEDCDRVAECPFDAKAVTGVDIQTGQLLLATGTIGYAIGRGPVGVVALKQFGFTQPVELYDFARDGTSQLFRTLPPRVVPKHLSSGEQSDRLLVAGTYSGAPDVGAGPLPDTTSGQFVASYPLGGPESAGRAATFPPGNAQVWAAAMFPHGPPYAVLSNATALDLGAGLAPTGGHTIVFEDHEWKPLVARPLVVSGTGTVIVLAMFWYGDPIVVGSITGTVDLGTGPLTGPGVFVVGVPQTGVPKLHGYFPGLTHAVASQDNWAAVTIVGNTNAPQNYGSGPIAPGMVVVGLSIGAPAPWVRSLSPSCIARGVEADDFSGHWRALLVAQCNQSVDLGSGVVPPGRMLMQVSPQPGNDWAQPLPSTDWEFARLFRRWDFTGSLIGVFGMAHAPLDFGTGPLSPAQSWAFASFIPWTGQ